MSQTNINHISDDAKYVTYDPVGTSFPPTVKNVKDALNEIAPWATKTKGLPVASETVAGIARVATQTEVDAGTLNNIFVTPKTLASRLQRPDATETQKGIIQLATIAEAAAFTLDTRAITPKKLGHVFNTVTAQTGRFGTIKLASSQLGEAATDNTTATTPKVVREMIAKFTPNPPEYFPATEAILGLVKVANVNQIKAGSINEGYVVTPYGFVNSRASQSQVGTVRLATQQETSAGTGDVAVSPATLINMRANYNGGLGITTLNLYRGSGYGALADNADVVFGSQTINGIPYGQGNIWLSADHVDAYTKGVSDSRYKYKWEGTGTFTNLGTAGGGPWDTSLILVSPNFEGRMGHAIVTLAVKFNPNNDSTTNRYFTFNILINGAVNQTHTVNIYNSKGGSRGHSWKFEGFATKILGVSNIPPNAQIHIQPVNNYLMASYDVSAVYSTT